MWDETTYPFPNFNARTVKVREFVSNFFPHVTTDDVWEWTWFSRTLLGMWLFIHDRIKSTLKVKGAPAGNLNTPNKQSWTAV